MYADDIQLHMSSSPERLINGNPWWLICIVQLGYDRAIHCLCGSFSNSWRRLLRNPLRYNRPEDLFLVLVACLLAFAYANEEAEVIKEYSEVNPEDFKYGLELSNSIRAEQDGHLQGEDNWVVKGEYEYVSKEGKRIKVTYTADESGYHPKVEQV
ncbi:larval cuticle protein 9-like [Stomoxys calcitrans]|uniref:larval cuticle protein 9-like n=1 Tax=Stomoxys calcitrans TaxID=35570 RepID=UPI0027E29BC1|nr:larval cuticle protein 9-like [Stomoxys calcitrans]